MKKGSKKPKRRRMVPCYVFLSEEDFEAVEAIRRDKGLSLSGTIRMVIKEWLRKEVKNAKN